MPAVEQERHFLLAPRQRRQARPARLETAADRALYKHTPSSYRVCESPSRSLAEVLEVEQPIEQALRALGDDHRARLRELLQSGGQVRRLADDRFLACGARAKEIAYDHEAGRDPDPRLERSAARRDKAGHGLDDGQSRPDRVLHLVLASPWPAKVGKHPVAQVLGDEAP